MTSIKVRSKTKTVKLLKQLIKCRKPCVTLTLGSNKRNNCFKKHCKTVVKKLLPKKRKTRKLTKYKGRRRQTHRMRGGSEKSSDPFVGPSWSANGAPNSGYYFKHSPYGVSPGGVDPYIGNNSPSPQHSYSQAGGGLWQQLITNPYRQAVGSLGNLRNIYNGQGMDPSPLPHLQNQLMPRLNN